MKLAQLLEIWKNFLAKEEEKTQNEDEILDEVEDFQKAVKRGYVKNRNKYLKSGPQDPGPAYPKKPKETRALSGPGPFAGA
tara:strand:+ start:787 stop:1029 length:243 start_codon:yes stop_codon:yes gene_type:complete